MQHLCRNQCVNTSFLSPLLISFCTICMHLQWMHWEETTLSTSMLSWRNGQAHTAIASGHADQHHSCICCSNKHFVAGWFVLSDDQFCNQLLVHSEVHSLYLAPSLFCYLPTQLPPSWYVWVAMFYLHLVSSFLAIWQHLAHHVCSYSQTHRHIYVFNAKRSFINGTEVKRLSKYTWWYLPVISWHNFMTTSYPNPYSEFCLHPR